ncbi:MAG TPA: RpiB/LacA/LacB family sugar-phosphate isomerase [Candidatus Paceibacterota bacterium]|nr:RpiB/LacA/LacB family sugar-phosphate isomerase [Candidatus Paceibacterota bacterium]
MKIFIAADHAGFELKQKLIPFLAGLGLSVVDHGAFKMDPDDDYPDFMKQVAKDVATDPSGSRGVVIGGSGFGEAMVVNRFKNVRAANFYGPKETIQAVDVAGRKSADPYEILRLSRLHNDANVLAMGSRFVTEEEAKEAIRVFLETKFQGEERHLRRIQKIDL